MGSLLIITGSMGAGKTSVLGEASDILTRRQIAHAAIDLDALGMAYLPTTTRNDKAMYCNLRSICTNYAALGVTRFLLSRASLGSIASKRTEVCHSAVYQCARSSSLFLHLIVTVVRLARPGGLSSVVAESLLVKHQLRILNRGRSRAPNLRAGERFIAGLCTPFS